MTRLLPLAVLLLCARASAGATPTPDEWQNAGFGRPLLTRVELESAYREVRAEPPSGRLTVHAVLPRGPRWTRTRVERHLRAAARVFARCGLMLDAAVLVEADAPARPSKFQKEGPGSLKHFIASSPLKERPVLYFFDGWSDLEDDRAFSSAPFTDGPLDDPALWESVFLPAGVDLPAYEEERRASPYSIAAHELLHVLTREGSHFNEEPRHLLNIWRSRSDAVRPDHCERALRHPSVRR
ncbi:MAG: hypothetical protein SF051_01960 [Elusimicrobiota bacterium]|nr:hypothetical protein [Elusimicrobiota bacterium]